MLANPRHEAFAQAFVLTGNAAEAWRRSGGKGNNADVHGPKWMGKDGMAARIAELRSGVEKEFSMTRKEWLARLKANADTALVNGDLAAERQSLREIGLSLSGFYTPLKQQIDLDTKPTPGPTLEGLLSTPGAFDTLADLLLVDPGHRAKLRVLLDAADRKDAAVTIPVPEPLRVVA